MDAPGVSGTSLSAAEASGGATGSGTALVAASGAVCVCATLGRAWKPPPKRTSAVRLFAQLLRGKIHVWLELAGVKSAPVCRTREGIDASFRSTIRVGLLARGHRIFIRRRNSLPSPVLKPSGVARALPTYSGGTAPASNRLPCYALRHPNVYLVVRAPHMPSPARAGQAHSPSAFTGAERSGCFARRAVVAPLSLTT